MQGEAAGVDQRQPQFLADRPLPANITRALRYVGPAVLSALTVNLLAGGQGIDGVEFVEVAAVGVAIAVAALMRNLIAALAAAQVDPPSREYSNTELVIGVPMLL